MGLQLRGDHLALARVSSVGLGHPGTHPRVEQLQWLRVEQARRGEGVRRLANTGALRDAQVRLVLAPGEYDLYQLPAPNVPEEELRDALRWQLRGTLPYAPEDAEIDFARIPAPLQQEDGSAQKPTVLVVAAPRATVEELVALFAVAGVEVSAVDVPEFSQRNLAMLQPLVQNTSAQPTLAPHTRFGTLGQNAGCVAWLSFDQDACLLTVQTGSAHPEASDLCFTRRIHIPGASGNIPAMHGTPEADQTVNYLIERIVTQVQRSLDVFERQSGQPPVTLLTVGPHRYGIAIAQTLSDRLALVCHTFEPSTHLHITQDIPAGDSPVWADAITALGVALRIEQSTATQGEGFAGALSRRWQILTQSRRRAA